MKTFKLVSLEALIKSGEDLKSKEIHFLDGLIIDREVEKERWMIEAYMDNEYEEFFGELIKNNKEVVLQVRITNVDNPKATLVAKVRAIEEIEEGKISVVLFGNMVNREREHIEKMLQELIEAGYQGKELLKKFKEKNQENIL